MSGIKYTPLDEAAEIVNERKSNEGLQAKLTMFVGDEIPRGPFSADPDACAVLAEYIARPTVRDIAFANDALGAGLAPWWLTYEQDQFVTANEKKVGMACPRLALANRQELAQKWLVPIGERRGSIGDLPTRFSELPTVPAFWQALRRLVMPRYGLTEQIDNVYDISAWYLRQAGKPGVPDLKKLAEGYYPGVMGLYAARAALFMDFEAYPGFKPIAEQGFECAARELGVDPIIVRWNSPNELESLDGKRMVNRSQTDLTCLDMKLPPRNQPELLGEVVRLILKELRGAN